MRAQMSKIFGHGLVLRGRGVVVYAGICKHDYRIDEQEPVREWRSFECDALFGCCNPVQYVA